MGYLFINYFCISWLQNIFSAGLGLFFFFITLSDGSKCLNNEDGLARVGGELTSHTVGLNSAAVTGRAVQLLDWGQVGWDCLQINMKSVFYYEWGPGVPH